MPFDKITTNSLALSSVTSDTILNNTIKFDDLSNDVLNAIYSGGVGVISKTYAELKTLKDASQLVAGQYYKITDFQTKWWNQGHPSKGAFYVITSSVTEPLIVLAISTNKFGVNVYSDLYPTDIIYYDFEAVVNSGMLYGSGIPNFKGWITRRIDTSRNIDVSLDWRHITVNCCRPDMTSIPQWSSTTTYSLWSVVKINNKLYYSLQNNNINNNPVPNPSYINTPTVYWRPISGFREGLTYFPTDELFGFYANKPDGSYLVNLPADSATRTQKYMFGTDAESGNNANSLDSYSNITIQGTGCWGNIFCGGGTQLKFGSNCYLNLLAYMESNTAGDNFKFNILFNNSGNKFGDGFEQNRSTIDTVHPSFSFSGNVFIGNTSNNIFLGGTTGNIFDVTTSYNHFGSITRGNKIGSNCYSNFFPHNQTRYNTLAPFFNSNFIDSNGAFEGNVTLGSCFRNTFGGRVGDNVFGNNFRDNIIGSDFTKNQIAANFISNTIGIYFTCNIIGDFNAYSTIGHYFRRNNVSAGAISDTNFTLSTQVYNNYDKTIFLNSAGTPRLSYYNSSDVQIVTSPTA